MTAQKVSLSGLISDTKEGTPLAGANVYLVGTSLGTATNGEGNYTISGISKGPYLVKVTYIGYATLEDSINIDEEDLKKDGFRSIADFISGMTDRYAINLHKSF